MLSFITSNIENSRIIWLDVAKGIVIFLMVMGHTGLPDVLTNWIFSFHMPFFFFMSGFLYKVERHPNLLLFLLKRSRQLIIPYLFFSVIIMITKNNILMSEEGTDYYAILFHGWDSFAIWFIPVLFFTEMVMWPILHFIKEKKKLLLLFISVGILGYLLYYNNIHVAYKLEAVFHASLFYGIGFLFSSKIQSINGAWNFTLLLCFVNFIASYYLPRTDMCYNQCGIFGLNALNAIIGSMATFILAKKLCEVKSEMLLNILKYPVAFFKWAGRNTMIIMGLSQIVMLLIISLFNTIGLGGVLSSISRHLLLWLILWGLSFWLLKYVPYLVGKIN